MIPKAIRWLLGVFAILGGVLACSAAQATRPPNIVFILTDDQGYRDLGCQGADGIQTPRIDRMAREGVRLTSIYAMATCSPTRAALLTGRYPARYRIHVPVNNPTGGLPPGETTLAEALKQQGYATGLIGKWHLGLSREMSPVAQGFDYFSGVPLSQIERGPHPTHDSYYRRQWRIQDAAGRDVVEYDPCEELFTQRCTQEAVEFIRRNHERPFFLYLAHPMPHGEIVASPKFAGKSPRGVYGDACQELDWSVGQVLDALTRLGLDQRTVVAARLRGPERRHHLTEPWHRRLEGPCEADSGIRPIYDRRAPRVDAEPCLLTVSRIMDVGHPQGKVPRAVYPEPRQAVVHHERTGKLNPDYARCRVGCGTGQVDERTVSLQFSEISAPRS